MKPLDTLPVRLLLIDPTIFSPFFLAKSRHAISGLSGRYLITIDRDRPSAHEVPMFYAYIYSYPSVVHGRDTCCQSRLSNSSVVIVEHPGRDGDDEASPISSEPGWQKSRWRIKWGCRSWLRCLMLWRPHSTEPSAAIRDSCFSEILAHAL